MIHRWFSQVRVRMIFGFCLMITLVLFASMILMLRTQISSNLNTRMSEISRYTVLVASDISQSEFLTGSPDYEEVDSMAAFYPEARILVLDDKCRVMKDSANTRLGRTVVNDDILSALAGISRSQIESIYGVIAVPILSNQGEEVQGIVYVSFSLEKQYQKAISNVESLLIILILSTILIMGVGSVIMYRGLSPLQKIRSWLLNNVNGHEEKPPKTRTGSEYHQMIQSVNRMIDDLRDTDNSRKEFVSNVSHELKTPLSSIKVLAESLLEEEDVSVETYREFLTDINEEMDRESSLVNDLLSLMRLENNKDSLNLKMVSMNDLAEIVLNRLSPLAEQKNLETVLENLTTVVAEVDEMKMTIAISNLVENAIKYNREGGSVRVKVDADYADAIIQVNDTGCGIPEEHFSKIFQRFYRVDKARERKAGGTGLGLAIVHQIVTMHHGTISVRSKEEIGTSFTVRIPLIAVKNPELKEGKNA